MLRVSDSGSSCLITYFIFQRFPLRAELLVLFRLEFCENLILDLQRSLMSNSLFIVRKACRLQLGAICSQNSVKRFITSSCKMASKDAGESGDTAHQGFDSSAEGGEAQVRAAQHHAQDTMNPNLKKAGEDSPDGQKGSTTQKTGHFDEGHGEVSRDEKHNQSLVGQGFVTGDTAGTGTTFQQQRGDPEITSGSGKDNEDGVSPVSLGGDYDTKYTKPEGEQDFDAVHGHKTDIPWSSGQGSGFDKDWQYEDKK